MALLRGIAVDFLGEGPVAAVEAEHPEDGPFKAEISRQSQTTTRHETHGGWGPRRAEAFRAAILKGPLLAGAVPVRYSVARAAHRLVVQFNWLGRPTSSQSR